MCEERDHAASGMRGVHLQERQQSMVTVWLDESAYRHLSKLAESKRVSRGTPLWWLVDDGLKKYARDLIDASDPLEHLCDGKGRRHE